MSETLRGDVTALPQLAELPDEVRAFLEWLKASNAPAGFAEFLDWVMTRAFQRAGSEEPCPRPSQPPQPGIIYPPREAAAYLGWTERALRAAAYRRRVPHRRVGRGIGFSADDIYEIIAAARVQPTVPLPEPIPPTPRRGGRKAATIPSQHLATDNPPLRARDTARIKI